MKAKYFPNSKILMIEGANSITTVQISGEQKWRKNVEEELVNLGLVFVDNNQWEINGAYYLKNVARKS